MATPPVPGLDNLFCKEILPQNQPKSPLEQLEAISSCPSDRFLEEERIPPGYKLLSGRWREQALPSLDKNILQMLRLL